MKRSRAPGLLGPAVLSALSLLAAPSLAGEPVTVPGGTESIRRLLGLDARWAERDFFVAVSQVLLTGTNPREAWDSNERRRAIVLFAEDLGKWRAEYGCPAALSTRDGRSKKTRRALDWLGFQVRGDGRELEAEPRTDPESLRRQAFLDLLGLSVSDALRRLAAGEEVTVSCGDGSAELPFGLAAWREILGADPKELGAGNAFLRFVTDVPASRMLVALHSIDPRTREELRTLAGPAGGAGGWKLLFDEALDGFARFPEALVLSGGKIHLPGGPDAEAAWADVVGESLSEKARFVERFYTVDSGKPAYVADALRPLPEGAARAFVLGRSAGGAAAVDRFRQLYGDVERAGRNHDRTQRNPWDFGHLARFLRFGERGELLAPGGVRVWLEALSGSRFPEDEKELSRRLEDAAKRPDDSDELLRRLFRQEVAGEALDVPAQKRFIFVSSLVEARPLLADPGTTFLLFRGLDRFLSACSVLEELPLDDAAVVRRYLFTLNRLDTTGTGRAAELRAGLFLASVELLTATSRSAALPDAAVLTLFRSLLDVPLFAERRVEPGAGLAGYERWLHGEFLPALRAEEGRFLASAQREAEERDEVLPGPAATSDELLAAALAGWRSPVEFAWRGGRYRWDTTFDGAARRRAFAATQQHVPLAALEDAISEREKSLAAARDGDADAVRASVERLLERLGASRLPGRDEDARIVWFGANARYVAGTLRSATRADVLGRTEEGLAAFDALRAERTLEALVVHVYSSSVSDPADLPYTDSLFTRRHSLAWGDPRAGFASSPFGPTRIEARSEEKVLKLGASFSGLPETLAVLHTASLVYESTAHLASDQVRAGLVAPVALVAPARLDDDTLLFVDRACRATEQLAAALAARPLADRLDFWDEIAGDLVPRLRRNALAEAPSGEVGAHLSPSDLYRIGRRLALRAGSGDPVLPAAAAAREARARLVSRFGETGAVARLAELGPRPLAWAGRNRLADLDLPAYERLAEYRSPLLFADRLYDLKIAVARAVVAASDPAGLLPLVLESALDEHLRHVRMTSAFDWRPLASTEVTLERTVRDEVLDRALEAGRITRAEGVGTW